MVNMCLLFKTIVFICVFSAHASALDIKAEEPDFASLINLLIQSPDDFTLNELILIGTQQIYIYLDESSLVANEHNLTEFFQNWVSIIRKLDENGTSAVSMGELKPYFFFFASLNSSDVDSVLKLINKLLFNNSNQNFLDVLADLDDSFTLNEVTIILTQNAIVDIQNSNNPPDNFEELTQAWISIVRKLNETGTSSVSLGELKPFLSILAASFAAQQTTSTPTSASATTTLMIENTSTVTDGVETDTSTTKTTSSAAVITTKIISAASTTVPSTIVSSVKPEAAEAVKRKTANLGVAVAVPICGSVILMLAIIIFIFTKGKKRNMNQAQLKEYETRF